MMYNQFCLFHIQNNVNIMYVAKVRIESIPNIGLSNDNCHNASTSKCEREIFENKHKQSKNKSSN